MRTSKITFFASFSLLLLVPPAFSQGSTGAKEAAAKVTAKTPAKAPAKAKRTAAILDLDVIFPPKRPFGPTARGMAFSFDGRYAAYLYRPYKERRHGNDLWLLNIKTHRSKRLTSVSVMARFQESAAKVEKDRKGKFGDSALGWLLGGGSNVGAKDAANEKAPRYSGVSSFTWSPVAEELLFSSEGDIYRFTIGKRRPERLTKTRAAESNVQYLPKGKGYAFLRENALIKVVFGSDRIVQIDPKLGTGERMTGYRFSPDGKSIAILAMKGSSSMFSAKRRVNIARYTGRFMEVRQVPRQVSDDPMPDVKVAFYLHVPGKDAEEKGTLSRVFEHRLSGPRDTFRVPEWSLDSHKVTFAVYEQKSGQVRILQAELPLKKAKDGKQVVKADAKAKPARVLERFLHTGGPTTPRMIRPQFLADNRHIIYLSEQTGYRHLHVLDTLYEAQEPLTHGSYEVYPVGLTKDRKWIFVTATKEDPSRLDIYRVSTKDGRMERISKQIGVYDHVAIGPAGKTVLATYVRFGLLQELVSIDCDRSLQRSVTRHSHPAIAKRLTALRPEFFSYPNRHGQKIRGYMFKPDDWTPEDKRPLLIYTYGGPLGTRKNVVEGSYGSDAYFFAYYMAKKHGYVTATIDPRGMSGYGAMFERANFEQVGKPQVEDLVDGAKYLIAHDGVDRKRMGIHGWSFGGFQTQMCLYTVPDFFACGMAGAGPTEWENYNSWYSQGTIGHTREGKADLKKFSLLPLAKNLKAHLLLVHGMEDSNVLFQDTVRVYRELLKAQKETLVELFLDPTGGHGLGGDIKRVQRARKYEAFLLQNLGEGEAFSAEASGEAANKVGEKAGKTKARPKPQAIQAAANKTGEHEGDQPEP